MIIKYTFNNNDFTQIIEEYLNEFGPFYTFNYRSVSELTQLKEFIKIYDNYNDKYDEEKELSKEAFQTIKNEIIKILYKNFKTYINNINSDSNWHTDGFDAKHLQEDKDYIIENLKISLVKSIPDQWENGEAVYFVVSNQKYITL